MVSRNDYSEGPELHPCRRVELPSRVIRTAHGTRFGGGIMTDTLVDYHALRAAGGVGLSILEIMSVHPTSPSGLNSFRSADRGRLRQAAAAGAPPWHEGVPADMAWRTPCPARRYGSREGGGVARSPRGAIRGPAATGWCPASGGPGTDTPQRPAGIAGTGNLSARGGCTSQLLDGGRRWAGHQSGRPHCCHRFGSQN